MQRNRQAYDRFTLIFDIDKVFPEGELTGVKREAARPSETATHDERSLLAAGEDFSQRATRVGRVRRAIVVAVSLEGQPVTC